MRGVTVKFHVGVSQSTSSSSLTPNNGILFLINVFFIARLHQNTLALFSAHVTEQMEQGKGEQIGTKLSHLEWNHLRLPQTQRIPWSNFPFFRDFVQKERTKPGWGSVSDHKIQPWLLPRLPKTRTWWHSVTSLCCRDRSATQLGKGRQGLESRNFLEMMGRTLSPSQERHHNSTSCQEFQ